MTKLTLSIDESVVKQAKQYAKSQGISVSKMVQTYLAEASAAHPEGEPEPVLRKIRSMVKNRNVTMDDYRAHLEQKYR